MRELELEFIGKGQVKGFKFTQVKKTNTGYIYKVDSGSHIYYEVFKRVENQRWGIVSYPKSKSFGLWAWSYATLPKAELKLLEFENAEIEKEVNNG